MFNDQEPEVRSTNIELSSSTSSKVTLTFQAVLQFLETFLIVLSRMIQNSKSPREVSSQCLNLWYSALKCLKPTSSYPTIILNYRRQAKYCICILLCILHIPSYLHRNTGKKWHQITCLSVTNYNTRTCNSYNYFLYVKAREIKLGIAIINAR